MRERRERASAERKGGREKMPPVGVRRVRRRNEE
jgi:hypothetical protein